ncbi:MAG: flagellar hook-basal body complex protein FliE [Candidimonas sp.]|nr:MAG: flagellar hook-basal body complex protein FliE [Candidimonas sp.]
MPASIESATALASMAALARKAGGLDPLQAGGATHAPFGDVLAAAIRQTNAAQSTAYEQADSYSAGTSDIPLNQVMIDLQKADIAFRTLAQVRDKVVSAYQTISGMAI